MRSLLISDDPFARGGLKRLLEQLGLQVVEHEADAVLWDLGLREVGELPDFGLPVLALAPDDERARLAMGLGVEGVLLRELDGSRISIALEAVAAGLRVVDPAFNALLPRPQEPLPDALTPRELQTVQAMALGLSNRGVGRRLGVSEHTAKFHVNGVLEKLGARNRTEAVVRAIRLGLLQP